MTDEPRLVASGFTFPETPRWHAGRDAYYFVDVDEGELYELKNGAARQLYKIDDCMAGMCFDDSDGFYLVSAFKRKILHLANALEGDGALTEFVDLSGEFRNGINDMTRGYSGELYVGGFNYNHFQYRKDPTTTTPQPGGLVTVSVDGSVTVARGHALFPNGIVVTPDGGRVLMADTLEHRIVSWPVNPDGGLGDMSVFAELPDEGPDGTCLDAEGAIWVASRKHAIRVREGGEVTDEITLDHEVTACALGGSDARTLLLTGAATRHSDPQTLHASRTGVVYEVHVDVPGAGRPSLYA